jgi:phage repressor protein C with HTH and peptisase S24 domain
MILGSRIRERISATGTSQAQLARAIGVSPQAVSKMVVGNTNESAKLYQIARFLRTTPEYLTGETDDPEAGEDSVADRQLGFRGADPEVPASGSDTVEIDEINVNFGFGGAFHDEPLKVTKVSFSRSWLRHFTDSAPEHLFSAVGIGDSMWPTIHDTDLVLVDRAEMTPRVADKLWCFAYGQVGMIKRLRPMPDGGIKILSDNDRVPPETAYDSELHMIGRVVAIVRKV